MGSCCQFLFYFDVEYMRSRRISLCKSSKRTIVFAFTACLSCTAHFSQTFVGRKAKTTEACSVRFRHRRPPEVCAVEVTRSWEHAFSLGGLPSPGSVATTG